MSECSLFVAPTLRLTPFSDKNESDDEEVIVRAIIAGIKLKQSTGTKLKMLKKKISTAHAEHIEPLNPEVVRETKQEER